MESVRLNQQGRSPWTQLILFLVFLFAVSWLLASHHTAFIDRVPLAPSLAVSHLRALCWALKDYRSANNSYPDAWDVDMSKHFERIRLKLDEFVHKPPDVMFKLDIQSSPKLVEDYLYRYRPLPAGCTEPHCTHYALSAIPAPQLYSTYKNGGLRSFFMDESETIHHCVGDGGADVDDPAIDAAPLAC